MLSQKTDGFFLGEKEHQQKNIPKMTFQCLSNPLAENHSPDSIAFLKV